MGMYLGETDGFASVSVATATQSSKQQVYDNQQGKPLDLRDLTQARCKGRGIHATQTRLGLYLT
jgi:hypothetical protein